MRPGSASFRMSVWLASTSLTLASVVPAVAQAQGQAGGQAGGQPQGDGGDPPALAGRLSELTGSVSLHSASDQTWIAATMNTPVTSGEGVWTEPQAAATIEIGADQVIMDGSTELDVTTLDQQHFVAVTAQGAIFLQLPQLPDGQSVTVNTPRAAVTINATGRYEIVAGDTNDATMVTVVEGSAHVSGSGVELDVQPQQTATISGTDTFQGNVGAMQTDGFLQAQLSRQVPQAPQNAPRQVQYMTGGCDLAQYGSWSQTSQYGQVWYPNNVPADWAPYRTGHWASIAPWGWTWVDDQPWGFAPFHYGRWVDYGGRWGWVAAAPDAPYDAYPVYAPALVSFLDVSGAALAGFAAGALIGGAVGWVPLGFREPYYPWYHVSGGYLQRINRVSVVNVRNIAIGNERNFDAGHLANARAATVMPAGAMARAERVQGIGRPLGAAALAGAHPVFGRPPVAAAAIRVGRSAPGPAFHSGAGPAGRPALRPATAMPANLRPSPNAGGHAAAVHPGLPALRAPHAVPPHLAEPGRPAPGVAATPPEAGRPGEARIGASHPRAPAEAMRPAEPVSHAQRPAEPERHAPQAVHAPAVHRAAAVPHVEHPAAHAAPRPEVHATRPEAGPAPRPAARPEPRPIPRPMPRPEAPHPHPPAPHPAPHPDERHK